MRANILKKIKEKLIFWMLRDLEKSQHEAVMNILESLKRLQKIPEALESLAPKLQELVNKEVELQGIYLSVADETLLPMQHPLPDEVINKFLTRGQELEKELRGK
jgi:Na+/phosphate symporter